MGGGQAPPAFDEETPVAFAEDQDVLRGGDLIEKSGATALEFFAGEKELHPAVVRREEVETHDGACRGSN